MALPHYLEYPTIVRTQMRNGMPYMCSSSTGDAIIESFVLRAERLTALRGQDMPQEEVDRIFHHVLEKTLRETFDAGEQIEPWRTLVRGAIPQYVMELDIHQERTLNSWHLAIAAESAVTRKAWTNIGFDVVADPDLGDAVLNRGHIIVPDDDAFKAYTYRIRYAGERAQFGFERDSRSWDSLARAREELRGGRELATIITASTSAAYDVARSVLPMFVIRHPDLNRPWADT